MQKKTIVEAGALAEFRKLVWAKLTAWDFFNELCRDIMFGEIDTARDVR